jgi:hypothetical protein
MAVRLLIDRRPQSTVAISSPHFVLDANGAVRHIPNEKVRMVSILEDSLEFDVIYQTNRQGLVDHRDYPVASGSGRRYAFAGDSFTYGMGADPWVPQLRDRVRAGGADIDIYNLGVNGASVQHFRALLSSVASELPVTDVVVIPISNDFYRPWWVPVHASDGTKMCWDPPDCTSVRSLYPIVDYDARPDALVRQYQDMRAARLAAQPAEPSWKRILWRSELYLLTRRRLLQLFRAPERDPYDLEDPARLDVNLEALAGIRRDFPTLPITLALFPQVDEVQQGAYHLDLAQAASHLDIDYFPALTRCSWSTDMYHRANLHPNARGYRSFADCLWRHLTRAR